MTEEHIGEFALQTRFVADNAWRLLALQDQDRESPSFGCFHLAYWRDKTSEFPDSRFQEAGATLGMLSLPRYDNLRELRILPTLDELYSGFSAAIYALEAQQYSSGCYDEWYKGERGFAATAFTTVAFGIAYRVMEDHVEASDRERLFSIFSKAGQWLLTREDLVKVNHEAVAAAALALAGDITGDTRLLAGARSKVESTLSTVTEEGWFPEISGMDLGYCSITLDYMMVYQLVTGDDLPLPAMRRLFSFMLPHIHPDGSVAPEAGTCRSQYVSRLGVGLLSRFDEQASQFVSVIKNQTVGRVGLRPALADELRFTRWSHVPIAVDLLQENFVTASEPVSEIANLFPADWTFRERAKIAAYHGHKFHVYFHPVSDGSLRCYVGHRLVVHDRGPLIRVRSKFHGAIGYDSGREVVAVDWGYQTLFQITEIGSFYPGLASRLLLRIGSVTPWSSKYLRAAIDVFRKSRKTALNQSATGLVGNHAGLTLNRSVAVLDRRVEIVDLLTASTGYLPDSKIDWRVIVEGKSREINDKSLVGKRELRVKKVYEFRGSEVGFSYSVD